MVCVLDDALFVRPEDAEVAPVYLDNASREESPLADLAPLHDGDGFDTKGIAVREHPSGAGKCTSPAT